MTCGVYRWLECDAEMTQLRHCPCYCGGLRWTVIAEFYGFGITSGFYRGMVGFMDDAVFPSGTGEVCGVLFVWWTERWR